MFLTKDEKTNFSRISLLFTLSFGLLLLIGTLYMAFSAFNLGFVLFLLGLVLLVGNEYLVYKRLLKKNRGAPTVSPSAAISEILNFAMVAYIAPSAIALFLFFMQGWGYEVLVIAVAGFTVTSVKVAAKTAQLFFSS